MVSIFYTAISDLFTGRKNEAYKEGTIFQKYCGCIYSYDESDHKKKPVYEFDRYYY